MNYQQHRKAEHDSLRHAINDVIPRAPPKPWRTQVLYCDIDTGEYIIGSCPHKNWTPIKREITVYETSKWYIREILYLCERSQQGSLDFRE